MTGAYSGAGADLLGQQLHAEWDTGAYLTCGDSRLINYFDSLLIDLLI